MPSTAATGIAMLSRHAAEARLEADVVVAENELARSGVAHVENDAAIAT